MVLASRSKQKGEEARARILQDIPQAEIDTLVLDLASLASINDFADTFKESYDRRDILLNNAGIMNTPYGTTLDGFEQQIGVNHLGHFALTGRLFPLINKPQGPE